MAQSITITTPPAPNTPTNPNPPTMASSSIPSGLCLPPIFNIKGQPPLETKDIFQNKICLYNDVTKQYEQYFQYLTVNPDNSDFNFYLYENLGVKLSSLPVGKVVPCVQDVHVVNDSGKLHETVDCNNTPSLKTFDSCTLEMVSKVSSGIAQVSSTLSTINSTLISELGKVSSGINQVSSTLNAINSTLISELGKVSSGITQVSSGLTAITSTLTAVNTNINTVNNSVNNAINSIDIVNTELSNNIRPLIQQTRDHIAEPTGKIIENTVTLPANQSTLILNSNNRRLAIITWFNTSDKREVLNLGYNGGAIQDNATAVRFGQTINIYSFMTKGEVWGISRADVVLNTVEFID